MDNRFAAVQETQSQFTQAANTALRQVQEAYGKLQGNQDNIAHESFQESQKNRDRDKSVETMHQQQLAIEAQIKHLRNLQIEHEEFSQRLAQETKTKFDVVSTAYSQQQDLLGSLPSMNADKPDLEPSSSSYLGADARNLRSNLVSSTQVFDSQCLVNESSVSDQPFQFPAPPTQNYTRNASEQAVDLLSSPTTPVIPSMSWPNGIKVNAPPVLDVSKYNSWRREFLFWRELYQFMPDNYMLSVIGAQGNSQLRLMVMKMFRETASHDHRRSIKLLLEYLDKSYEATAREKEMNALETLISLKRDASESTHGFWLRFEGILALLDNSSTMFSSELIFMRALKSLQLTHVQKTAILTSLDCKNQDHNLDNLRAASIRLFGMYRDDTAKPDSRAYVTNEAMGQLSDDDVLVVRKMKPKRNKPGMESQSIRRSHGLVNLDNQVLVQEKNSGGKPNSNQIICFRCGKNDHTVRTCPMPYQKVLAFLPNAKSKPRNILMLNDHAEDIVDAKETHITNDSTGQETAETPTENQSGESAHVHMATEEEISEDQWIANWLSTTDQVMTCEDYIEDVFGMSKPKSFSTDNNPLLIIDSGASSTVCGLSRLIEISSKYNLKMPSEFKSSNKTFRFGNQMTYKSIGSIVMKGTVRGRNEVSTQAVENLSFKVDIIRLELPLLISRSSLRSMGATLDFKLERFCLPNGFQSSLILSHSGHVSIPWIPNDIVSDSLIDKSSETIHIEEQLPDYEEAVPLPVPSNIMKVHLHLGHADISTLVRIYRLAGHKISSSIIESALSSCSCGKIGSVPQNPIVSRYLSEFPGQSIFLDVFFPTDLQKAPAVLVVCSFSKFVCARFISNLSPRSIIGVLLHHWTVLFGMPEVIITDKGSHFCGSEWNSLCNTFSIGMVHAPTGAHFQLGTAERQVGILKKAFRHIRQTEGSLWANQDLLAIVCSSRNITPLSSSHFSPFML